MPSRLFSPFTLRGLTLPNRIVVSPMAQYSGTTGNEASDWHLMHYGNFSVSGAGLMFFEATAVEPRGRVGRFDLGLWNDAQQESIARVMAFCRQHGQAKIAMQLAHSGRKGSTAQPWMGGKYIGPEEGGWHPISPGDLAFPGRPAPRMLDHAGLAEIKEFFVQATWRADSLGIDVNECHSEPGLSLKDIGLCRRTHAMEVGVGGGV